MSCELASIWLSHSLISVAIRLLAPSLSAVCCILPWMTPESCPRQNSPHQSNPRITADREQRGNFGVLAKVSSRFLVSCVAQWDTQQQRREGISPELQLEQRISRIFFLCIKKKKWGKVHKKCSGMWIYSVGYTQPIGSHHWKLESSIRCWFDPAKLVMPRTVLGGVWGTTEYGVQIQGNFPSSSTHV